MLVLLSSFHDQDYCHELRQLGLGYPFARESLKSVHPGPCPSLASYAKVARPYQKSQISCFGAVVQSLFSHSVALGVYLFYMAFASDLDKSSESEYEIDKSQEPELNFDKDECDQVKLETSKETSQEYNGLPWSIQAQLHRNIKASAKLLDLTYQKLPRSQPI